jgi:hypothetical protein
MIFFQIARFNLEHPVRCSWYKQTRRTTSTRWPWLAHWLPQEAGSWQEPIAFDPVASVPEPAALSLIPFGLVMSAFLRRRQVTMNDADDHAISTLKV